MSSFFTRPASQKRKRAPVASKTPKKRQKTQDRPGEDESISGSESSASSRAASPAPSGSSSGDENETEASRRLKLAEQYLENVKKDVAQEQNVDPDAFDAADVDRDLIAVRLKEDVAEGRGRIYKRIASTLSWDSAECARFGTDSQSVIGVGMDGTGKYAWTASKDCVVAKWELQSLVNPGERRGTDTTRRKPKQLAYRKGGTRKRAGDIKYKHHTAQILCLAVSHDGQFVATGGADRRLIIWRGSDLKPLKVFTHHRDAVMSLAFRGKTNQLFSAGKDRTIKIWSLDELAYVETLFGHQDEVVDVTAVGGGQERCVSVGARDRTSRLWKVVEESQLVFRGGGLTSLGKLGPEQNREEGDETTERPRAFEGSVDRVIQLDSQLFVTGSDNGSLSLFALSKKKPLHVLPLSHGYDEPLPAEQSWAEVDVSTRKTNALPTPRYVTAMARIPFSDLFITGSWDGAVRVWRLSEDSKRIERVGAIGGEALRELTNFDITEANDEARLPKRTTTGGSLIRGVVNDLDVVEMGERGKDGLRVLAGVGKEMRSGRWMRKSGKNETVLFEIPRV
ncbi:MAG: hypothetical protein Q9159_000823 [Coniocarpon cinnabarinum]